MVGGQRMKLGKRNVGKQVAVVIEDGCFHIMYGAEELAVRQCKTTGPLAGIKTTSKSQNPEPRPPKAP